MKYCIVTIIKNEQKYLNEWLQYHINLGIDNIFVFEDTGSESHRDICSKYNNVTLLPIEFTNNIIFITNKRISQIARYQRIIYYLKYKYDFDWVIYIDVDEFLTLQDDNNTLDNIFEQFMEYDFVQLQWMNYNANNHIYLQDNVINSYTEKCGFLKEQIIHNSRSKLAINMNHWKLCLFSHNHHQVFKGNYCKTNFGKNKDIMCYDKIYIRHYITKSFEDWVYKIFIRGQFYNSKKFNDFFILNPNMDKKQLMELLPSIIQKYNNKIL